MGIQEALEFFEIPRGRHQTLGNVRGKNHSYRHNKRLTSHFMAFLWVLTIDDNSA